MAKAVIAYDKDLPEIPGRRPWEKPTSYLVKDDAAPTGWREETSGRRPSKLLLVPKIREAVDAWRESGYEGASNVTQRLFEYWFEEDHSNIDMVLHTQLASGSAKNPKCGFKIVTAKVRAGAPIYFFDSGELVNETGL